MLISASTAVSPFSISHIVHITGRVETWWNRMRQLSYTPFDTQNQAVEYDEEEAIATGRPNLMQLAQDLNLNLCIQNLKLTGLDRILNHEGWMTLFCPTDEAYITEPFMPGDDTLIEKMRLTVARGLYNSSYFHNEATFRSMLSQRKIRINQYETGNETQIITANGQPIESMDHRARNGYLHVLGGVMNSVYDRYGSVISELEACCPQHKDLIDLVKYSGLYDEIDTADSVTFLAPTNGAFVRLHPDFVIHLMKNKPLLTKVLKAHMINGTWYTIGLNEGTELKSWSGEYITISKEQDGHIKFSNARAGVITNINASNGVTHSVESLIMSPSIRQEVYALLDKLHNQKQIRQIDEALWSTFSNQ